MPRESAGASPIALSLKRLLDVVGGAILLACAAPVILAAAALVRATSPGPAFFVQRRIGYRGREFNMYKLRTMRNGAERLEARLAARRRGQIFLKIPADPRTTRVGRWLRKCSIDELPQLWNVLRGEMSLVGPRPLLLCDFEKFPAAEQWRRFSMQPGLTGLWQVSGRSLRTDEERMALDLEYVERWSLWLDLRILARTIPVVLSGKGAT
jgi:lipopolysaccharide/colanic/teichoic acid biosynthesis glycosyltransferase